MQRSGVLSDTSIIDKCVYAELPIPVSQYTNVMGVQKSSVFVTRQPKDYRAPPQIIPYYVAKNAAQGTGMSKLLSQKMIEQDLKARMSQTGSFDVLKGPPLLVGSSTQDFRVKNIQKMIQVVERPAPKPPEMVYQMPGRNTRSQENAISRMVALSNARVRVPGFSAPGSSLVSGITTEVDASTLKQSTASGVSLYARSIASKASTASSGGTVTDPYVARVLPFNRAEAEERGLAGPSTVIQPDPALRDSFGPLQQQMLAQTIRYVNNPIMRSDETFSYGQRQLRSGSTQETGFGIPSLPLERVPVQARGQAGPQLIQPAKAAPPPGEA